LLPLFPAFIIFFIASIAETNRAPFDLAEAESELVSGFMTEHSAVIFVFFFLAEYASIVLICILNNILFIGGYLFNSFLNKYIYYMYSYILLFTNSSYLKNNQLIPDYFLINTTLEGISYSLSLGIKTSILIFVFI
jgi:NADH-ubiquinone oxidoreductase chain 1